MTSVNDRLEQATVEQESSQKICLFFDVENLGDKGFNDLQYAVAAKMRMQENFQLIIETSPIKVLHEKFRKSAHGGCDLLVAAGGYSMKASVLELAPKYPEKTFILMGDMVDVEFTNLVTAHFRTAETAYLAGILAADMSDTGVLSIVAGADVPAVNDFILGFTQGAKDSRPDILIFTEYIDNFTKTKTPWSKPYIAAQITNEMTVSEHADVILSVAGGSNLGTFTAAKKLEIKAIAVDINQDYIVKGVILTSIIKNTDNVLKIMIHNYLKGTLKCGNHAFGLADGGVSISPMLYSRHMVSPATLNKITTAQKAIIDGKIKVATAWVSSEENDAQQ